jgi:hypothetical protein
LLNSIIFQKDKKKEYQKTNVETTVATTANKDIFRPEAKSQNPFPAKQNNCEFSELGGRGVESEYLQSPPYLSILEMLQS